MLFFFFWFSNYFNIKNRLHLYIKEKNQVMIYLVSYTTGIFIFRFKSKYMYTLPVCSDLITVLKRRLIWDIFSNRRACIQYLDSNPALARLAHTPCTPHSPQEHHNHVFRRHRATARVIFFPPHARLRPVSP